MYPDSAIGFSLIPQRHLDKDSTEKDQPLRIQTGPHQYRPSLPGIVEALNFGHDPWSKTTRPSMFASSTAQHFLPQREATPLKFSTQTSYYISSPVRRSHSPTKTHPSLPQNLRPEGNNTLYGGNHLAFDPEWALSTHSQAHPLHPRYLVQILSECGPQRQQITLPERHNTHANTHCGESDRYTAPFTKVDLMRNFGTHDFKTSLSEVKINSHALHEWSKQCSKIALEQHSQSLNSVPDRMPQYGQIVEMIHKSNDITIGLLQMRQDVVNHEQCRRVNGRQEREQGLRVEVYDDEMSLNAYESKPHILAENKKRRRKPGSTNWCHSCNASKTPEWRRGPDWVGTLCNACGIHYSKLTRSRLAPGIGSKGKNTNK